jgi:predicted transcriptional regulator of viral defense system
MVISKTYLALVRVFDARGHVELISDMASELCSRKRRGISRVQSGVYLVAVEYYEKEQADGRNHVSSPLL